MYVNATIILNYSNHESRAFQETAVFQLRIEIDYVIVRTSLVDESLCLRVD